MAPTQDLPVASSAEHSALLNRDITRVTKPKTADGLVLESWAQGFMVGALIIMAAITVANMRRGVLLHKLILIELILGTFHGTFMFTHEPVYGWYLSVTAIFLNISWSLHNVIAWMKTKPFLSKRWSWFYIGTVVLAQPYWVVEIYANFTYFNNINTLFLRTRPYEALCRDPWWIFSTLNLFWNIHTSYRLPILSIITISPRFGVLLTAMVTSVAFIIVDIVAVTSNLSNQLPDGLNPFWKLAFVFKCLTDSIVLDDFKTALDRLMRFKMRKEQFGTADDTLGATAESSAFNDQDWTGNGMGGQGTKIAARGGFDRSSNARGTLAPPAGTGRDDPLGENTMEDDLLDRQEAQAFAGTQERCVDPNYGKNSGDHAGRSVGANGGAISFADALREGGDLEKNARKPMVNATARGSKSSSSSGVGENMPQHWEDLHLPEFASDEKDSGG